MFQLIDSELLMLAHEQPQEPTSKSNITKQVQALPVLQLAFRSFFLLATLCSLVGIGIWILFLNGHFVLEAAINPTSLHMHEMIFGFGATVATGFLLTAVQTWTGLPSIKGLALLVVITLWVGVRVFLHLGTDASLFIAVALQTMWWLSIIFYFAKLVIISANHRNLQFIPILTLLMLLNIGFLLTDFYGHSDIAIHLARTAILMFCVLMGVVGGRVIPFFTVSGARTAPIKPQNSLTIATISASLLCTFIFFLEKFMTTPIPSSLLMIVAGTLHLARILFWRSMSAKRIPLLWSLHLSYAFVGLGLITLGISSYSNSIRFGDALHILTIAAMGLMIFSMMSRVSLGHTGRKLQPPKAISLLFLLIIAAAITRFALPTISLHLLGWNMSAAFWIAACIIFLTVYFPILTKPRIVDTGRV